MDLLKKIKNYTYNQRHCLGQGSFGRVYEGKSEEGSRVAIKKVQQRTISKDVYLRASLQTEISIMKKLNHPNIVKLYDIVMTVNHIYLIMQFCGGGDLKRYCRNRKLPQEQANQIIKQICKGFQEIVKHGIIHRDLKPANILVHEGIFKICDFGFAKFFSDTSKMARTCVGTPIYMSPQVLHQKSYTNKTDIWSLGVLFYQLLFAKLPYYGSSEQQLYRAIVKTNLQIPVCSKSTAYLLKNMLEVDQNKRFNWNQLFDHFQLGQLEQDHRRQIFPPPPQQQKVQIQNKFYRQPSSYEQLPPPPPKNNYIQSELQNNIGILNDSPMKRAQRNYLREDFSNEKDKQEQKKTIPQRKPKNPLAFQNISQHNAMGNSVNKQAENQIRNQMGDNQQNPRFFYFVLVQLIVSPIQNCQSYPKFISTLYHETINLYDQMLQKTKTGVYKKVLMSELQEIKSLQAEIPNYKGGSLKEDAETLIFQINQKNRTRENLKNMKWVEKLLVGDFTYSNGG